MAKERRCNLWDDNGRPRRLTNGTKGCPRDASACLFAHPHEREWKSAKPSRPPRHELVADDDADFFYILVDARKSSLDSHRRDSLTGPRSRGPAFDSSMDSGGSRRARSRSPSSTSDQLERSRSDKDKYYRTDYPPHRDSSRRSRSRSRDKGNDWVDHARKPSPARSHVVTDTRVLAPPPEPFKPPPMQPPPPPPKLPEVPKIPLFASTQQRTGSVATPLPKGLKDLSVNEQRKAWYARIDLMLASITSRRDYAKLESDLVQIQALLNSSLTPNMPETRRVLLKERKIALELEMERKRKEINEVIQNLINSEFWPVIRAPHVAELEKGLGEVKKHVLDVKNLADDLKNSCVALFKARAESVPSDWTSNSDRPSKRMRLEGDMHEDTARELEALRDKLSVMDSHITELENDVTQRDQNISDSIDLFITARLEEEVALCSPVKLPGGSRSEIEAVVDAKHEELNRVITAAGDDIGALATEVAELITRINDLEAKCRVLEAENEDIKKKIAQDLPKLEAAEVALARRDKEIEAIAAALQAYISQAPVQSSGELPSAEYIIEALDSQLDGLFRDKFCAMLVEIQQEAFDKVQESRNHTLNTVSPKIMLLLKMVNLITARVGKPDMDTIDK